MGTEIERKYLVNGTDWKTSVTGTRYKQGYLSILKERTVRVRSIGNLGFITIKGITRGVSRAEYEYPIPVEDALEMLNDLCEKPLIEKIRYKVPFADLVWEIDEFLGENEGLIFAEVELKTEAQKIEIPPWIGEEVTSNPRYFNSNLTKNPFKNWK